ncbi:hypothetical protein VUR80DRAFT_1552 [Thermomyces stellatus]
MQGCASCGVDLRRTALNSRKDNEYILMLLVFDLRLETNLGCPRGCSSRSEPLSLYLPTSEAYLSLPNHRPLICSKRRPVCRSKISRFSPIPRKALSLTYARRCPPPSIPAEAPRMILNIVER